MMADRNRQMFMCSVFSNVSSNPLPCPAQSHIGCISLTFLQSGFSNVSSNGLSEILHSFTSCICLISLHFGLSDVSSDKMPHMYEKMYILVHNGFRHNCLTFLQCVFSSSSESPNCQPEKRHFTMGKLQQEVGNSFFFIFEREISLEYLDTDEMGG